MITLGRFEADVRHCHCPSIHRSDNRRDLHGSKVSQTETGRRRSVFRPVGTCDGDLLNGFAIAILVARATDGYDVLPAIRHLGCDYDVQRGVASRIQIDRIGKGTNRQDASRIRP